MDSSESELAILDLIQAYVQCLDKCFENVCELDLVFNYGQAGLILDEFIMGGLVIETSSAKILQIHADIQVSPPYARRLGCTRC